MILINILGWKPSYCLLFSSSSLSSLLLSLLWNYHPSHFHRLLDELSWRREKKKPVLPLSTHHSWNLCFKRTKSSRGKRKSRGGDHSNEMRKQRGTERESRCQMQLLNIKYHSFARYWQWIRAGDRWDIWPGVLVPSQTRTHCKTQTLWL